MGFSVSTSLAVVVVGVFAVLGGVYTATTNTYERVQAANHDSQEGFDAAQETAINVTAAEVISGGSNCIVRVNVTNTGSTALSLDDTDVLIDGTYQSGWQGDATVDGDGTTNLWLPEDRLSLNVTDAPSPPSRAKVVTETGVAVFAPVEGGSLC